MDGTRHGLLYFYLIDFTHEMTKGSLFLLFGPARLGIKTLEEQAVGGRTSLA